jgi:hypothetical protein
MHLAKPFDPISPGEWDNFGFNFTPDLGTASIVATNWTCTLKQAGAIVDPLPQSHVAAAYAQTQIGTAEGPLLFPMPPEVAVVLSGAFSVARIGGFTAAQAGATYTLAATVQTSDGRTLTLSADLPVGAS